MSEFSSQPVRPHPSAPTRRPTLLFGMLVLLVLVLAMPSIVERARYAATRGRMRAEADVAEERLQKLSEKAGLVALADTSHAFNLVVKKIEPSVVHIDVAQVSNGTVRDDLGFLFPDVPQIMRGQGSGFIVDDKGYILTNRHVVAGAAEIRVTLADGRTIRDVHLVGDDELTDLAVLKIDAPQLSSIDWGDSAALQVGDWVLAIGNPFELDRTVTCGIISAKQRRRITEASSYQDFLQTDAAVNPGNSGGPLVNLRGEVVGVNTAIIGRAYQGISFAIPSEVARNSYEQIIRTGRVARGWLGVRYQELSEELANQLGLEEDHGALIRQVLTDSPAAKAGLQAGDVVLEWNHHAVSDATELALAIAATEIGSKVPVVVWRDRDRKTLEVEVGQRPDRLPRRR